MSHLEAAFTLRRLGFVRNGTCRGRDRYTHAAPRIVFYLNPRTAVNVARLERIAQELTGARVRDMPVNLDYNVEGLDR